MENEWRSVMDGLGWDAHGPVKALVIGHENTLCKGPLLELHSPIDGQLITCCAMAQPSDLDKAIQGAQYSFNFWKKIPAPKRGALVAKIAELVKQDKSILAQLITLEAGKTKQEALGEVQEWIDICEFAVGLSRQLYGLTLVSERQNHRMMEQWHPLGPIGVITSFNFPMAVWSWNTMLALVCGDTVIWKPSEKTPLCALACQSIFAKALGYFPEWNDFSQGLSSVVIGGPDIGQALAQDSRVPLISATGSVAMGKKVATTVASRLGKSLLELGGNNGLILTPSANLDLAIRGIVFAAVGTTGQRCTTLRRLIVQRSIHDQVIKKLQAAYAQITPGDPRHENTLLGPLIDQHAFEAMQHAIQCALKQGGTLLFGGQRYTSAALSDAAYYVVPALIRIDSSAEIIQHETFAPILYVMCYDELSEAITLHNHVPQGLSSAIFTRDMQEAEIFLSPAGSDCGIANVNIGTSGAEIGGAFGGEKESGGGRESGSDAWRNYMRRVTNTINYGSELPLAQGIEFNFDSSV